MSSAATGCRGPRGKCRRCEHVMLTPREAQCQVCLSCFHLKCVQRQVEGTVTPELLARFDQPPWACSRCLYHGVLPRENPRPPDPLPDGSARCGKCLQGVPAAGAARCGGCAGAWHEPCAAAGTQDWMCPVCTLAAWRACSQQPHCAAECADGRVRHAKVVCVGCGLLFSRGCARLSHGQLRELRRRPAPWRCAPCWAQASKKALRPPLAPRLALEPPRRGPLPRPAPEEEFAVYAASAAGRAVQRFAGAYVACFPHGEVGDEATLSAAYARLAAAADTPHAGVEAVRARCERFKEQVRYMLKLLLRPLLLQLSSLPTGGRALHAAPAWLRAADRVLTLMPRVLKELDPQELLSSLSAAAARGSRQPGEMFRALTHTYDLDYSQLTDLWTAYEQYCIQKLQAIAHLSVYPPGLNLSPREWPAADSALRARPQPQPWLVYESSSVGVGPLRLLVHLARRYRLEHAAPPPLRRRRWVTALRRYREKRLSSSLLLLQRRWWELKVDARSKVLAHWRARDHKPPAQLLLTIAERYPHVVCEPLPSWRAVLAQGLLVEVPEEEIELVSPASSVPVSDEEDFELPEINIQTDATLETQDETNIQADTGAGASAGTQADSANNIDDIDMIIDPEMEKSIANLQSIDPKNAQASIIFDSSDDDDDNDGLVINEDVMTDDLDRVSDMDVDTHDSDVNMRTATENVTGIIDNVSVNKDVDSATTLSSAECPIEASLSESVSSTNIISEHSSIENVNNLNEVNTTENVENNLIAYDNVLENTAANNMTVVTDDSCHAIDNAKNNDSENILKTNVSVGENINNIPSENSSKDNTKSVDDNVNQTKENSDNETPCHSNIETDATSEGDRQTNVENTTEAGGNENIKSINTDEHPPENVEKEIENSQRIEDSLENRNETANENDINTDVPSQSAFTENIEEEIGNGGRTEDLIENKNETSDENEINTDISSKTAVAENIEKEMEKGDRTEDLLENRNETSNENEFNTDIPLKTALAENPEVETAIDCNDPPIVLNKSNKSPAEAAETTKTIDNTIEPSRNDDIDTIIANIANNYVTTSNIIESSDVEMVGKLGPFTMNEDVDSDDSASSGENNLTMDVDFEEDEVTSACSVIDPKLTQCPVVVLPRIDTVPDRAVHVGPAAAPRHTALAHTPAPLSGPLHSMRRLCRPLCVRLERLPGELQAGEGGRDVTSQVADEANKAGGKEDSYVDEKTDTAAMPTLGELRALLACARLARAPGRHCCAARRHRALADARRRAQWGRHRYHSADHNYHRSAHESRSICNCCCLHLIRFAPPTERALARLRGFLLRQARQALAGVPAYVRTASAKRARMLKALAKAAEKETAAQAESIREKRDEYEEQKRAKRRKKKQDYKNKKQREKLMGKEVETDTEPAPRNEYEEWIRQRNITKRFFTLQPFSSLKKPTSVPPPVVPRLRPNNAKGNDVTSHNSTANDVTNKDNSDVTAPPSKLAKTSDKVIDVEAFPKTIKKEPDLILVDENPIAPKPEVVLPPTPTKPVKAEPKIFIHESPAGLIFNPSFRSIKDTNIQSGSNPSQNITVTTNPSQNFTIDINPSQNITTGINLSQNFTTGINPSQNITVTSNLELQKLSQNFKTGADPSQNFTIDINPSQNFTTGSNPSQNFTTGSNSSQNFTTGNFPSPNFTTGIIPGQSITTGFNPSQNIIPVVASTSNASPNVVPTPFSQTHNYFIVCPQPNQSQETNEGRTMMVLPLTISIDQPILVGTHDDAKPQTLNQPLPTFVQMQPKTEKIQTPKVEQINEIQTLKVEQINEIQTTNVQEINKIQTPKVVEQKIIIQRQPVAPRKVPIPQLKLQQKLTITSPPPESKTRIITTPKIVKLKAITRAQIAGMNVKMKTNQDEQATAENPATSQNKPLIVNPQLEYKQLLSLTKTDNSRTDLTNKIVKFSDAIHQNVNKTPGPKYVTILPKPDSSVCAGLSMPDISTVQKEVVITKSLTKYVFGRKADGARRESDEGTDAIHRQSAGGEGPETQENIVNEGAAGGVYGGVVDPAPSLADHDYETQHCAELPTISGVVSLPPTVDLTEDDDCLITNQQPAPSSGVGTEPSTSLPEHEPLLTPAAALDPLPLSPGDDYVRERHVSSVRLDADAKPFALLRLDLDHACWTLPSGELVVTSAAVSCRRPVYHMICTTGFQPCRITFGPAAQPPEQAGGIKVKSFARETPNHDASMELVSAEDKLFRRVCDSPPMYAKVVSSVPGVPAAAALAAGGGVQLYCRRRDALLPLRPRPPRALRCVRAHAAQYIAHRFNIYQKTVLGGDCTPWTAEQGHVEPDRLAFAHGARRRSLLKPKKENKEGDSH